MQVKMEAGWQAVLQPVFDTDWFGQLATFIKAEYKTGTIYPAASQIFSAFNTTPFASVKVVILGQDPYHGPAQAHGLSFSVSDGVPLPPSLQNMYKELETDLGITPPQSGNLLHWANQGVLLLNSSFTVRAGLPASHAGMGWEKLSDAAISAVSAERVHCAFVLWGAFAQKKESLIDTTKHLVIKSSHPSPLSAYRGFLGSKPFSQINTFLLSTAQQPINWV